VGGSNDTSSATYSERLKTLSGARWKQVLDVQRPYRWNLKRLLGDRRTLDVGCGIGRNLANLTPDSVGVDHNDSSVNHCRRQDLQAYTASDFHALEPDTRGTFDGLLAAHLVEHLPAGAAAEVVGEYLAYLNVGATIVLICPQERGFASDSTHTVFTDNAALGVLCRELGLDVTHQYSFPFPRAVGRIFTYNEFVTVARYGAQG
jgi:SAM-dependent methyltransferase